MKRRAEPTPPFRLQLDQCSRDFQPVLGKCHFHRAKFLCIDFIVTAAGNHGEAFNQWLDFRVGVIQRITSALCQPTEPKTTWLKKIRLRCALDLLKPSDSSFVKVAGITRNGEPLSAFGDKSRVRFV